MKCRIALYWLVAVAAMLAVSHAGSAQSPGRIYVIESSVNSIKVGREYGLADTITIPAGASIRAVMPSGKTQKITGPYSGPVADLAKGQKLNETVFAWIRDFFQTGGSREKTIGATRGMRVPSPASFSWTAVPVTADSTICVAKGARVQLVREPSQNAQRVTVVDIESSLKGEVRWAGGSSATAWPADVALRPDATYTLLVPDQPPRQATLRMLERIPEDDEVLSELAARGCQHQFDAWMKERTSR